MEVTKTKPKRERIKVTNSSLEERMNSCLHRQQRSYFNSKDEQETAGKNKFLIKLLVSFVIFGILYAMSIADYEFTNKAMHQVQQAFEHDINIDDTIPAFSEEFGQIFSGGLQ